VSVPLLPLLGDYFAGKALDAVGEVVRDVVDARPNPFEDVRRRMGAEAGFELGLAFERHVKEQEKRDAGFREKLREKVTAREAGALFSSLLREAAESSTRERMRMMCAVLAGVWRPDLDAELRSRVARAVLDLEPSDVLYLRALAADEGRPGVVLRLGPQGEWLVRAGCVLDESGRVGGAVRITDVGHALLAAVATWAPEASPSTG
jgi:hypothetical protein